MLAATAKTTAIIITLPPHYSIKESFGFMIKVKGTGSFTDKLVVSQKKKNKNVLGS